MKNEKKKLVTSNLTYSSNTFSAFVAVKASHVAIYIIVVKYIIFTFQKQSSEGVEKYIILQ